MKKAAITIHPDFRIGEISGRLFGAFLEPIGSMVNGSMYNPKHPTADEQGMRRDFYEALKAGPLYYTDLQAKVQRLLNCSISMWNHMFREMRDRAVIVRGKNRDGKAVWQLPKTQAGPSPEIDLFDQIAADLGYSPTS